MLSTLLLCLCRLNKSINGSTQSIMDVHHKTNRPNCRKFLLPAVCLVAYELSINKQQLCVTICKMWTTTLQGCAALMNFPTRHYSTFCYKLIAQFSVTCNRTTVHYTHTMWRHSTIQRFTFWIYFRPKSIRLERSGAMYNNS